MNAAARHPRPPLEHAHPADIRRHLGIITTSPARTLLDVAPRLGEVALSRAVNDLRISGQLGNDELARLVERMPRHPGAKLLRPFVECPTGPTRSEFEDAFLDFAQRYGLPRPEGNVKVAGYEVDALFRQERVIVELDGFDYHRDRTSFEADRERDADTLAHGHLTVRITWERLRGSEAPEAERLLAILEERRG